MLEEDDEKQQKSRDPTTAETTTTTVTKQTEEQPAASHHVTSPKVSHAFADTVKAFAEASGSSNCSSSKASRKNATNSTFGGFKNVADGEKHSNACDDPAADIKKSPEPDRLNVTNSSSGDHWDDVPPPSKCAASSSSSNIKSRQQERHFAAVVHSNTKNKPAAASAAAARRAALLTTNTAKNRKRKHNQAGSVASSSNRASKSRSSTSTTTPTTTNPKKPSTSSTQASSNLAQSSQENESVESIVASQLESMVEAVAAGEEEDKEDEDDECECGSHHHHHHHHAELGDYEGEEVVFCNGCGEFFHTDDVDEDEHMFCGDDSSEDEDGDDDAGDDNDDDDDDDDDPVDVHDLLFHTIETDSAESSSSDNSNDSSSSSSTTTVMNETVTAADRDAVVNVTVSTVDPADSTAAAAAAADGGAAAPPTGDFSAQIAEAATDAGARQRRVARAAAAAARAERRSKQRRKEAKTPPDSDYENIDSINVCQPAPPVERYGGNLNYKIYAKEATVLDHRNKLAFGNSIYGSLLSARKLELMRKLGDTKQGIDGHEGCVNACNFSEDGSLLVSGSDDLHACIWDWARTDAAKFKFDTGHRQNVFQTKFLPFSGNSVILTCARDGHVRLAELSESNCKGTRKIGEHTDSAHKLAMRYDNRSQFYSCGEDGYVKHYDLRDSKTSRNIVAVRKRRNSSWIKSDAERRREAAAAAANSNNDNDTGEQEERRAADAGDDDDDDDNSLITLYAIDCNPLNTNEFVVSGVDDTIRIYDLRSVRGGTSNSEPMKTFCPAKFKARKMKHISASCVVYDWNGSSILASYNDHNIFEFNTRGSSSSPTSGGSGNHYDKPQHVFRGHRNRSTVKGVNYFGPHSEFVVSGSDCGHVFVWHRQSERVVNMLPADEGGVVNVLESHPTVPVLATSGLDHDVKIWVPSNESPIDNSDRINKRARKNIKERKNYEKRPVMSVPGHFMMALLNHLNSQRARGEGGDDEEDAVNADGNAEAASSEQHHQAAEEESAAVSASSSTRRLRRRRGDRASSGGGGGDSDSDAEDERPVRCGLS